MQLLLLLPRLPPSPLFPLEPTQPKPKRAPREAATHLLLRVGRVPARSPTYPAPLSHVPLPLRASDWPPHPS
nr:unnamed protein product [Digitaria exilis]CAB3458457.1 unnamed protein product [Digitaria exilis]